MPQIVNTNIMSLRAQRNLRRHTLSLNRSMERLASGLRINRAADDPAAAAIRQRRAGDVPSAYPDRIDRAILAGVEGPDHTVKLPGYGERQLEAVRARRQVASVARRHREMVFVLVVGDQATEVVRGQDLRRREVPSCERRLAGARL